MAPSKAFPPASAQKALSLFFFMFLIFIIFYSGHIMTASRGKHGASARRLLCSKKEITEKTVELISLIWIAFC